MQRQIEAVRDAVADGISRADLLELLPPGGARNALDCALWDVEAKRSGRRAWDLVGIPSPEPVITDFTISLDNPQAMAESALAARAMARLKLKLGGEGDIQRVAAVRDVRPDAELIVDANQAWSVRQLHEFTPRLADLGVKLIEQPLPAGQDEALAEYDSPIPLCADESCQSLDSLPALKGKYSHVNIKLDKTGGLTEALRLADAAQAANFCLMVGCMGGSSLSMAPGFILAQRCRFVDLDGPLLANSDMPHAIRYQDGLMMPPRPELWG